VLEFEKELTNPSDTNSNNSRNHNLPLVRSQIKTTTEKNEKSISTNAKDFVDLSEKTDSLFDKVLIQVKEKNKGNQHFYFR
jgi:hypothetical protein